MAGTGGATPSARTALPSQAGVAADATPGCAELVHDLAWERTPMGPMDAWDPMVRATVEVVVASPVPMALVHGDEFTLIYNDAYADVLGASIRPRWAARPPRSSASCGRRRAWAA